MRGLYRSTPHRVENRAGRSRLSLPFFLDPDFQATVRPLPLDPSLTAGITDDQAQRWDRRSVHTFEGTYGDYILRKIGLSGAGGCMTGTPAAQGTGRRATS